jgi:3-hydroxymyristoyl/3-hydroxydecanoyl-(acyl carrier protein) dehydratase
MPREWAVAGTEAAGEQSWTVPLHHVVFAGHFPGRPIVPGVMLLDRVIMFAEGLAGRAAGAWQIASAKFLAPVGPGTELVFSLTPRERGGMAFSIRAGAREVASGTLLAVTP